MDQLWNCHDNSKNAKRRFGYLDTVGDENYILKNAFYLFFFPYTALAFEYILLNLIFAYIMLILMNEIIICI